MDMDRVRIDDVITTEYSDFLSFCSASGKIFISELTNVDFVAFRTSSGQSRDYIKSIRAMLDNPVVAATTEVDAVQKGSESEKNELQGDPFDAGEHLALEDQSTPSKTESPSWIQPNEQPEKNIEAALDETSCYDRKNDTENKTADRTTEEIVVTSTGTETTLHRLDLRGILVSTGSACDSSSTQVSHVIRAINVPDSYAKGTIRISLGKDNTVEEAKIIGETLVSVLMEQK